jgi:hypothetical protein
MSLNPRLTWILDWIPPPFRGDLVVGVAPKAEALFSLVGFVGRLGQAPRSSLFRRAKTARARASGLLAKLPRCIPALSKPGSIATIKGMFHPEKHPPRVVGAERAAESSPGLQMHKSTCPVVGLQQIVSDPDYWILAPEF